MSEPAPVSTPASPRDDRPETARPISRDYSAIEANAPQPTSPTPDAADQPMTGSDDVLAATAAAPPPNLPADLSDPALPGRSARADDAPGSPAPGAPPLPRTAFSTLKRRKEFLAAANRGRNCATPGLMLQARLRETGEPAETPVRIGYTCSKKVGNAVARNRAKRRLRAAAAAVLPGAARAGWDYVLVGRSEVTAGRPFEDLLVDLRGGLARLHAREDEGRPERPRAPSGKRRGKGGAKPPAKAKGGPKG